MSDIPYKPTSRRPIADPLRATAKGLVQWCVKKNIHPDTISYLSIVSAAIAGALFWKSSTHDYFLLLAPLFGYVRLYFNMLDGMVALASGKASLHGEIINEMPDRVSDLLIFWGVAYSSWASPFWGMLAAALAIMTAYVGVLGQAAGVQREFSGVMSKPWRMVALHIGAWLAYFLFAYRVLDWTLIVICLGCIQTIVIRLHRILLAIHAKSPQRLE